MNTPRSWMVGMVLVGVSLLALTTWQLVGVRGGAQVALRSRAASELAQRSDTAVWNLPERVTSEEVQSARRREMVEQQLAARDIRDRRVLDAMLLVPRHRFVPDNAVDHAYLDGPLPIGQGQTISQPYIVGLMTQLARPHAEAIALDIGTGSGYQAAVLSLLCRHVYSMEIVESLADAARERLARLGYTNVTVRVGDGYAGWEEHSPFDLIIVAAAPERIPQPLIDQLKPAGRRVIPVGKFSQDLIVVHKQPDGSVRRESVIPVAFVPMTGQAQR
jgi:protein-L-isoaspartate(D-aspartate) O-methyltransferase